MSAEPPTPLTRRQIKEFRKLSNEDQRAYLEARLVDEAMVWVDYFMQNGSDLDRRLSHRFIISPKQM